MDIRNVQRTGNMHYVYLPTSWCKQHNISSKTKVSLEVNSDGSLSISPKHTKREARKINLKISDTDPEIIHKLIVASYINPASSFEIILQEEQDLDKVLDQKRLLSLELVEVEGNKITCESSISVYEPLALFRTLLHKIKNMIVVMTKSYNKDLIERYEEEIDRSKTLIDKAVLGSFTFSEKYDMSPHELHYIALLTKDLEKMVDHLINLEKDDLKFIGSLTDSINFITELFDNGKDFDYVAAINFCKKVLEIKKPKTKDIKGYDKSLIRQYLVNISEVLIDWAITKQIIVK